MESKTLQAFEEAIKSETIVTIKDGDYVVGDIDLAAEACYKIHKAECIKFINFVIDFDGHREYTTEELFDLYQQSKDK